MRSNSTQLRHRTLPSTVASSADIQIPNVQKSNKETLKKTKSKSNNNAKCVLFAGLLINTVFITFIAIAHKYASGDYHYVAGLKTIYVVLATLGDYACPMTINELLKNAKYPQNIQIGVYQQNEKDDPDCLAMLQQCTNRNKQVLHSELGDITTLCNMRHNIIINRTTVESGAKGCHYGRHMTLKLMQNKPDFVLFVDSHSLFRQHWDEYVMKMWYTIETNREHAVITHYPCGAETLHQRIENRDAYSYHICGSEFAGAPNYMLRNSNGCWVNNVHTPVRVAYWAGGFAFSRAHFWQHVPLDPYIQYVFDGDEMNVATRGWTHGYDFYSPPVDIVGHYYSNNGPKRRSPHVEGNSEYVEKKDKSEKRINYMWGLLPASNVSQAELSELDRYGLGNKRTLQQYWKFAGIDPVSKQTTVWNPSVYSNGGLPYVAY